VYQHILIPTDGSKLSDRAAAAGVKLAAALGARVTGLYVAPPATPLVYEHFMPVKYMTPEQHAEAIALASGRCLGVIEKAATAACPANSSASPATTRPTRSFKRQRGASATWSSWRRTVAAAWRPCCWAARRRRFSPMPRWRCSCTASAPAYLTTSTGTPACSIALCATEPSSAAVWLARPRAPSTIRSQPCTRATSAIVGPGGPTRWCSW
jgi:hypothetical protein